MTRPISRWGGLTTGILAILFAVAAGSPPGVVAQDANMTVLSSTSQASKVHRRALVDLENVSLEAALMAVQSASGVSLAFSPTLLPRAHSVSCACANVTVAAALDRILQGTGLDYVNGEDQVIILPAVPDRGRAAVRAEVQMPSQNAPPALTDFRPGTRPQPQGSLTGTVTDARSGEPLPTVQVYLAGTGLGTLTNESGRYLILNVPPGTYTIHAERIGFTPVSQETSIAEGQTQVLDFTMAEQALDLEGLVVTGPSSRARRREVGNSISQINLETDLFQPADLEEALTSKVPGLTVMQSGGSLGSAAQIRLRGNVSVSQSNQPLVYIDGVRVRSEPYPKNVSLGESDNRSQNDLSSPLNDINPSDIARIEVIKGAAATTLYGTEASAGVIQIFTKRGQRGAAIWNMDIEQGVSWLQEFAPEPAPKMYMDPFLRNAHRQKYTLSVRGGTEAVTYSVSGSYEDALGVLPNDDLEKLSVRGNFEFEPLEDLTIQWNTYFSQATSHNTPQGNNSHGLTLNVYRQERGYLSSSEPEVIRQVLDFDIGAQTDHLTTGLTATYSPSATFTNRVTVGYDLANQNMWNVRPFGFVRAPEGRLSNVAFRNQILTLDYIGSVELPELMPELQTTVSFGGQSVTEEEHRVDAYGRNLPGRSNPTVSSASETQGFEEKLRVINAGFFGQLLFGLKDRYFANLGARIDGNSSFGSDFGLQFYPKISFSYVMSDEDFWPSSLGQIKWRAALGESGRAPGAFDAVRTWDPVGHGGLAAFYPRSLGNPNLGPERTREIEFGFDYATLEGRLAVDFTYYRQKTTDALFSVRLPPSQGQLNAQLRNVGELKNSGLEIQINSAVLERDNLLWDVGLGIATNNNEVVSLGGAAPFSVGNNGWIVEGYPAPVIRGVKILNPHEIAEPRLDEDYFFGPDQPTLTLNLSTSLELPGNVTVSARAERQSGAFITDGATSNAQSRNVASWPTCVEALSMIDAGRYDELPAVERQRCVTTNYVPRSHIYPTDFIKLREVSLRFPVPIEIPGASSAYVTLTGHNLYRWLNEDFPIFDPEMLANEGAVQRARAFNETIPPPASFTGSLRIVF